MVGPMQVYNPNNKWVWLNHTIKKAWLTSMMHSSDSRYAASPVINLEINALRLYLLFTGSSMPMETYIRILSNAHQILTSSVGQRFSLFAQILFFFIGDLFTLWRLGVRLLTAIISRCASYLRCRTLIGESPSSDLL